MSSFTSIDLSRLPAPSIVDVSDFETILAALKADLVAAKPDLADVLDLESEPLVKVLETWAYRELLLRTAINEAGRGTLLAFATGGNLDQIAAFFNVARQVVTPQDLAQVPPVSAVLESDDRLRARVQLSFEGFTTAGSIGSYVFWALDASTDVKDVSVGSTVPGEVQVAVLSGVGDGVADGTLLGVVSSALSADDRRPLTDLVVVRTAAIVNYSVEAVLSIYPGPDASLVLAASQAAVDAYVVDHHRLGHDISISGLHAALHGAGVQNVNLIEPAADIVIASTEAAFCTSLTVTVGGVNV
jgi:phage-related baseplate assembly protein